MKPAPDLFKLNTDIGVIGLSRNQAQELYTQLGQFLGHNNPGTITPEMLAAGCEASWMLRNNRWLLNEVRGIIKRVYTAMRALE